MFVFNVISVTDKSYRDVTVKAVHSSEQCISFLLLMNTSFLLLSDISFMIHVIVFQIHLTMYSKEAKKQNIQC